MRDVPLAEDLGVPMAPELGFGKMSVDMLRYSFLNIVDSTLWEAPGAQPNKSKNHEHVRNRIALLANSLDNCRI